MTVLKGFDRYNQVARIRPALITAGPVYLTLLAWKPELVTADWASALRSSVVACMILGLFVSVTRYLGKGVEAKLLDAEGGWRTTILLRHRDSTIDPHTKARYHQRLAALGTWRWPSPRDELDAPEAADAVYRSATKRLIELRRDPRYSLLHEENAEYGFRRNLLGLKRAAIAILLALVLFVVIGVTAATTSDGASFVAVVVANVGVCTASLVNLALLLIWVKVVHPEFVLQAADDYAMALFRTLEEDPQP